MQLNTERFVAMKVLEKKKDSSPKFADNVKKEINILQELSHPHII